MKHAETLTDIAPDQEAELTYLPEWQDTPFVIRDLAENLAPMAEQLMRQDEGLQARAESRTHKLASRMVKAVQRPENGSDEALQPMVQYTPLTTKQKVRDWLSDAQWRKADKDLGIDGTELSIVHQRQVNRRASRILVATIAAGVEQPPVWGKYKKALKMAEKTIAS
jgi:hypothetical protein